MTYDLSILIPARNEMFLAQTIENILENIEGNTEIIAVLDGAWTNPPIKYNPRVTVLYFPKSIGQRAATNQACRLSKAKYVMKIDAHCAVDKGFDIKMMNEMQDDWTMVPTMYNLHAFDWVCTKCAKRDYQGPTHNCTDCGSEMTREIVWTPRKGGPRSNFYRFDNTMHFQYWKEFEKRPEGKPDIAPSMSIQGSCFMLTRQKYWELDISSEKFESWGQQGVEVACKTWLSGGQVMINKKTWYAHMFRTQGGDFGFPYPNPGGSIDRNRKLSRELFMGNKWEGAKHSFQWLLDKFAPIPDWGISKGVLYYTDSELDESLATKCRTQLREACGDRRIVSVSLKKLDFGDNIHIDRKRGYVTMAKQILAGLEELKSDVVFFCEHDVLYHASHFDFVPPEKDKYYYNTNVWRMRLSDGHAVKTADCRQLSGLCVYRETALVHFKKRVEILEKAEKELSPEEFNKLVRKMGFEPGTHNREERVDNTRSDKWESAGCNVDIRHDTNLTPSRWAKDQFRNQKYTEGWQETDEIPGWSNVKEMLTLK